MKELECRWQDLWRGQDETTLLSFFMFNCFFLDDLGCQSGGSPEEWRIDADGVIAHQQQQLYQTTLLKTNHIFLHLLKNSQQALTTPSCKRTLSSATFWHHLAVEKIQSIVMNTEQKVKNKSDKLAKQSLALLERLKNRKEKVNVAANQQNYIEDLYLKIFNRVSPHFDKMQTSNQILSSYNLQTKCLKQAQQDYQEALKEASELKDQILRLKESKDESTKMKTLNAELNKLEQMRQENNALIKTLKRENQSLSLELGQTRQQLEKVNKMNAQLEQFVQTITKELEENVGKIHLKEQYQTQLTKLQTEKQNLQDQLARLQTTNNRDSHQNKQLQEELKQKVKIQHQLRERQSILNQQIIQQQSIISQLQKQKKISQQQRTKQASQIAKAQFSIQSYLQEKQQLGEKLKFAEITLNDQQTKIKNLSSINTKLLTEIESLNSMINQKSQNLNKLSQEMLILKEHAKQNAQELINIKQLLESSTQTNHKLVHQNQQLEQAHVQLTNKLSKNEEQAKGKIEQFKQRLKFFKEANQVLNNQKIDLINNVELLASQTKDLADKLTEKDQQINFILNEKNSQIKAALKDREIQLKKEWKHQQSLFQKKLQETVKYYEGILSQRNNQLTKIKNQQDTHLKMAVNRQQDITKSIESLKVQINQKEINLLQALKQSEEFQTKMTQQLKRIQRLQYEKHDLQIALESHSQSKAQQISNIQNQLQESKQRLLISKEERDHLNQEKNILKQQNQKINELNTKLKSEINEKKLKIHKNQEKITELNQIINSLNTVQIPQTASAPQQLPTDQKELKKEEPKEGKCNKHIDTINELSGELTEAYKMIQELQHTITQLRAKTQQKSDKQQKGSVQKKQRGRSIKKIAGMFGF